MCLLDEDEIDTNADASISASKTIEAKNKDTTAEQSKILSKNLPPPNKRVRSKRIIIYSGNEFVENNQLYIE